MTMQTREKLLQKLESVTVVKSSKWKEHAARKAENSKALEKSRIIVNQYFCSIAKAQNESEGLG